MSTYIVPQVLVFQELELIPAIIQNPLRAFVSGGHAQLVRFSDSDEKQFGSLGPYDSGIENCYIWPNRATGGVIDEDFTKLFIEDALLQYFQDLIGSDSTITKLAGASNKIRSDTVNFAANQSGVLVFPRDAALLDRDVQIGDIAFVRAVVGPDVYELLTSVKALEGDAIAADILDLFEDPSNPATILTATQVVVKTDGDDNCVTLAAGVDYDGIADGFLSETYRIRVTQSSVGGDATTGRLRIFSASGTDDVLTVIPSAFGVPTAIGTRSLEVTFDLDATVACSLSATNDDVPADDLILGQEWEVTVTQAYDDPQDLDPDPAFASAGTYTGDQATTYIIEVTKGQTAALMLSDPPEITVTTTNGIDVSGPTQITGVPTLLFPVGTKGVQLEWSEVLTSGLLKGNRYYIPVLPQDDGAMRTIVLNNSLPNDTLVPPGTEVDLTLYIKKPSLEVEANRTGSAPLTNWTQSETEICVQDSISGAFDSSWALSGVPQPLPVTGGNLFVEYRAWLPNLAHEVNAIHDVALLNAQISGALVPENELKWGVFKALSNSNGTEVKYAAVEDPNDVDEWIDVLELINGRRDVYGLVPLTTNKTVYDLFAAHVGNQSNEINNRWRVLWANLHAVPEKVVVSVANSSDTDVVLCTITDDPETTGSQFTIVNSPADNAKFITNGVRPGDIVRTLFTTDGFGNTLYSEFVIDEVTSENELRLKAGPGAPINIAQLMEIWRNLTATEESAEIAQEAGSYGSRRVRATWPDLISSGGVEMAGYHMNAALAGLVSGVVPHQGLTRLELAGFDDVSRTVDKFNKTQLDAMAVAGAWIVTQDTITGQISTRHAVTTGDYADILEREEMITRNLDSISFEVFDLFDPFIGISNITPTFITFARSLLETLITDLQNRNRIQRLGPQLVEGIIERLEQSQLIKDRLLVQLRLTLPSPLNNVEAHLIAQL
jgi:hypothetical protein